MTDRSEQQDAINAAVAEATGRDPEEMVQMTRLIARIVSDEIRGFTSAMAERGVHPATTLWSIIQIAAHHLHKDTPEAPVPELLRDLADMQAAKAAGLWISAELQARLERNGFEKTLAILQRAMKAGMQ